MSAPLSKSEVLHWQRMFASAGYYKGKLDGIWGPLTDEADMEWEDHYASLRDRLGARDTRTERHLSGILPRAQERARQLLAVLDRWSDARIISGTRSYAEQDALWEIGRTGATAKQPRVTNARGGQSLHNFGIAFDIGLFEEGRYMEEPSLYDRAGAMVEEVAGLEWGGAWKTFPDRPHYQIATKLRIGEIRRHFEAGALGLWL